MKETFKKIIRVYVTTVQKVLITVLLFLVYVIGFGIMSVFMGVFRHKLLRDAPAGENTMWKKADGYEPDMNEALRES